MRAPLRRVLILDTDPDTLITLQHGLESAEADTTITWDEAEARHLLETSLFDVVVIGDHPPEIDAASILRDIRFQSTSFQSFILGGMVPEECVDYFREIGAVEVLPKRDIAVVIEQVTRALTSMTFKPSAEQAA